MSDPESSDLSDFDTFPDDHPDGPQSQDSAEESEQAEDLDGAEESDQAEDLIKDNDTEAETERLEFTPRKPLNSTVNHNDDDENPPTSSAISIDPVDLPQYRNHSPPPLDFNMNGMSSPPRRSLTPQRESSNDLTGRKRKRTSSLSPVENGASLVLEPSKKRTSSARYASAISLSHTRALSKRISHEQEIQRESAIDENLSDDGAVDMTVDTNVVDDPMEEDIPKPLPDPMNRDTLEDAEAVEDLEDKLEEDAEAEAEAEDEDNIRPEGDEDEVDLAAKSEAELVRKKTAYDALQPIEDLFAIFRDKLFDEKLAEISTELQSLESDNPTHPKFLAMRRCLDIRRDEKVHLEETGLHYKIKTLEITTLASRAAAHSQYFQAVRDNRERSLDALNNHFCRIQHDRRQWKSSEPKFNYSYDPSRSTQILYQTAYNKEVSLLSGIAKHRGFPAAPELPGASAADAEDDLRKIKMKSVERASYSNVANSTYRLEMAGEEHFLEKNPWANPSHPRVQQQIMLERQAITDPYVEPNQSSRIIEIPKSPHETFQSYTPSAPNLNTAIKRSDPSPQLLISKSPPAEQKDRHNLGSPRSGPLQRVRELTSQRAPYRYGAVKSDLQRQRVSPERLSIFAPVSSRRAVSPDGVNLTIKDPNSGPTLTHPLPSPSDEIRARQDQYGFPTQYLQDKHVVNGGMPPALGTERVDAR